MQPIPLNDIPRCGSPRVPSRLVAISVTVLIAGALACGPTEPTADPSPLVHQRQAIGADNGLALNGLSANGLSANGLSANGLSANGLSANGLSQLSFTSWFEQDPAFSDMVMRYVVRCSVPAGQSRTYTDPRTQTTYTWPGELGLAPGWANGQAATLEEQQLVSACLAAHANKFGVSVTISVLGEDSAGRFIPFSDEELHQYSRKEACFFGNLFTGEGVFFGVDSPRLHDNESSPRACALSSTEPELRNDCQPLAYVGRCKDLCARVHGEKFYLECSLNGVSYKPITTRVAKRDIYECGDGICQFTEACGRSNRSRSCEKDCGRCPGDED
jgi:GLTT repeat (6 copies)